MFIGCSFTQETLWLEPNGTKRPHYKNKLVLICYCSCHGNLTLLKKVPRHNEIRSTKLLPWHFRGLTLGSSLTLDVLYHTMPHTPCRFEVNDVHSLQCFVWTHSEGHESFAFHPMSAVRKTFNSWMFSHFLFNPDRKGLWSLKYSPLTPGC